MNESTTTADPVCWGVLSTAKIGRRAVIPAIAEASNARLVAIASRDTARAQTTASEYPGTRVLESYRALLDDSEVEAVYIPLPNSMHVEWAIRALEAGKHVLCEKPLGITADEVRRIRTASEQAGRHVMEAFMYRFHPQIRWTLEQLAAGRIGDVRMVRSAFVFDLHSRPNDIRLQGALGGGSLMDVGCYPLNFCRTVFGGPPRDIAARVVVPPGSNVELATGAVLDFGAGRLGVIDSSFTLPREFFAEIIGEHGRIFLPSPYTPGRGETVVRVELGDETLERRFGGIDQYTLEVESFSSSIRHDLAPFISLEDSLEQIESIERIYDAAGYTPPWLAAPAL
ncbi:MAG TPA: Gfo/Idh/MocA family oxidoreductase [Ktedonobacterales bacterium]|nr:Gfo/Idh/MocA family oxidoreductase [Ktedonobacterales bacterium]